MDGNPFRFLGLLGGRKNAVAAEAARAAADDASAAAVGAEDIAYAYACLLRAC